MLVMYNRYHNYAATQLRRINENGRFQVPRRFRKEKSTAIAENFHIPTDKGDNFYNDLQEYSKAWKIYCERGQPQVLENGAAETKGLGEQAHGEKRPEEKAKVKAENQARRHLAEYRAAVNKMYDLIAHRAKVPRVDVDDFSKAYDTAWSKLDDDLFNTARL